MIIFPLAEAMTRRLMIRVIYGIRHSAIFARAFKVTNSVNNNPFENNALLDSTKNTSGQAHGYGIKNIKATAEKYSGILKNEYKDGMFTSSVMISENQEINSI